ncbi:MAG: putative transcriptional regulatory protein [Hyphomicrobiaceae bacterium hypho_1]
MAGHSQFKNIMHRKGRQDAARSKLFSKLSREITVAAKMGSSDPSMNSHLRLSVQNAKSQSMPKENIERAIKRALSVDESNFVEIRYEGYGPNGVAVIAEALTDNRNRTGAFVRATFAKYGGNLGSTGSVGYMFDRVGEISYPVIVGTPYSVLEAAVEAGAYDVESDDSGHMVICSFDTLGTVASEIESILGEPESVKAVWKPKTTNYVDEDGFNSIMKLVNALEDDDDIQNVFSNFEVDAITMNRIFTS